MERRVVGESLKSGISWNDHDEIFKFPIEVPPSEVPKSPRLEGVTACARPVTPRLEVALTTPGRNGLRETNISSQGLLSTPACTGVRRVGFANQEELLIDQQLESIQEVLAEQKRELNRVAASFEKRLVALCTGMPRQESPSNMQETGMQSAAFQECETKKTLQTRCAYVADHKFQRNNGRKASLVSAFSVPEHKLESSEAQQDYNVFKGWAAQKDGPRRESSYRSSISNKTQRDGCARLVQHTAFEVCSCAIISLDAILTGAAADYSARSQDQNAADIFRDIGLLFLIWYSFELLLRFTAERRRFFFSGWNIFDLVLVSFDVFAKIYAAASGEASAFDGVAVARMCRMFRLFRAFRVFRLLRFLRELRMMAKCILACSKTVVWVLLLMCMNIYVFAVYLIGQVSPVFYEGELIDSTSEVILKRRFGTLSDASFSLFMAISGGISWVEFTDPLISIHWTNGLVVFIFIFFTTFAMLNIITGVFVDSAVTAGRTDEEEVLHNIIDDENSSIKKLRQVFECVNMDGDDHLDLDELESQMGDPEVRLLFKSIGIGVHQVRGLFKLLDLDGSGQVTVDEFITGCMRLKDGSALDLSTMLYENKRMMLKLKVFYFETLDGFASLHEHISSLEESIFNMQAGE